MGRRVPHTTASGDGVSKTATVGDIAWFVPNLIGYLRLALVLGFVVCDCLEAWNTAVLLYLVSALLDGVDGFLARRLDQCSKFGEVLDVVVDMYVPVSSLEHAAWMRLAGCAFDSIPFLRDAQYSLQRASLWSLTAKVQPHLSAIVAVIICFEWMCFASTHAQYVAWLCAPIYHSCV